MDSVRQVYRNEMAGLGGAGRVRRTAELFEAGRAILEARALRAHPRLEGEALRIAVARMLYRKESVIRRYLDQHEATLSA